MRPQASDIVTAMEFSGVESDVHDPPRRNAVEPDARAPGPVGRTVSLLLLLLAAVSATWALVNPLASVPDEPAHVMYAAAVVRGDFGSGPIGVIVHIPAKLSTDLAIGCTAFHPEIPLWKCPAVPPTGDVIVVAQSTAGGRPPLYYALVGWVSYLPFLSTTGTWMLMRLLSVAVGVSLIGLPFWLIRFRRPGWLVLGVLGAFTPLVGFFLGSVNPSSLEIAAAIGMCVAAAGLFGAGPGTTRDEMNRRAAALAVTSAVLVLARPFTYAELAGLLLTFALLTPRASRGAASTHLGLLARWALVPLVAIVAALVFARLHPFVETPNQPSVRALLGYVFDMFPTLPGYLIENVGIYGWRDYALPEGLKWLGIALPGTLLLVGFAAGRRLQRLGLLVLTVGATVVAPLAVGVLVFKDVWIAYQGRYSMALIVGLPILGAAVAMLGGVHPARVGRWTAGAAVWMVLLLNVYSWGMTVVRYSAGFPFLSKAPARVAEFHWYLGAVATAAALVAFGTTVWLAWALSRRLQLPTTWVDEEPATPVPALETA